MSQVQPNLAQICWELWPVMEKQEKEPVGGAEGESE